MSYVEFLKTKVRGKLTNIFLPYDSSGRIHLPEPGENPCVSCGDYVPYENACYHFNKCGAQQYYLKKEKISENINRKKCVSKGIE